MSFNESLLPNSNYPPMSQSEWDAAPFNQVDPPTKTIDITVSVTLSKTLQIEVDDTENWQDYTDLNQLVEEQYWLPQEAGDILEASADGEGISHRQINDLKGWTVDEFEVIEE